MIKQLKYSVTFPSTGRTFNEAVLFQDGFGAIVGPNESGKSMILEMVRFCLFGSAALRGKSEDYKNLKATLDFQIRGVDYIVDRTSSKAQLKNGDVVEAVGTTPVNVKIAQLLGFGLTVFDMACVANQNQLLALGDMRPADRRRAVDSVIGVSILDDMSTSAGKEATALKRAADDLQGNTSEPVEPLAPEGYRLSVDLAGEKAKLDDLKAEADRLRGWLSAEMAEPRPPNNPHNATSEFLQSMVDAQNARDIERRSLEAELNRIPEARNVTQEELDADRQRHRELSKHRARRQFLTFNRMPDLDQGQIDTLRRVWEAYNTGIKLNHLQKQRSDLLAKGHHTCPSCEHSWAIAGDALDKIDGEISTLADLPTLNEKPTTSEADVDRHQRTLDAWNKVKEEWETVHQFAPEVQPEVQFTIEHIISLEAGLKQQDRRNELIDEIAKLKPAEKELNWPQMLRDVQQFEARRDAYLIQKASYDAWVEQKTQNEMKLAFLEVDLQGYQDLVQALDRARHYEIRLAEYERALAQYHQVTATITGYRLDAEDWNKVKEALSLLRSKIKQYLVPSLNKVASSLISHMTGGERQTITVDEDFNILVDGQTIDTLSGSGKAVANLSLRIGLGQVLTNNIFSLFMGDEIDESMDKNRADKTAQVMFTLKGRISQLLLVSHKSPSADYTIAVGDNSEYQLNDFQPD